MKKKKISIYEQVVEFKKKYNSTVAWRLKQNSKVVEKHINSDEKVLYVFAAQKNDSMFDFFTTAVVVLTNKRLLVGRKRLLFGYFLDSITPDMFNDLKVLSGVFWGKIKIDTVNELVVLSNIDKDALDEIETEITSYMMEQKNGTKGLKDK